MLAGVDLEFGNNDDLFRRHLNKNVDALIFGLRNQSRVQVHEMNIKRLDCCISGLRKRACSCRHERSQTV